MFSSNLCAAMTSSWANTGLHHKALIKTIGGGNLLFPSLKWPEFIFYRLFVIMPHDALLRWSNNTGLQKSN